MRRPRSTGFERSCLRSKKGARRCGGIVMFEDEASFWLDGTLHRTWSRVGVQPRVDTYGQRKTAHVFGAVSLEEAAFAYEFADASSTATLSGTSSYASWHASHLGRCCSSSTTPPITGCPKMAERGYAVIEGRSNCIAYPPTPRSSIRWSRYGR